MSIKEYRRIYAIPDIHGRLDLLDNLLLKIDEDGFDKAQDTLVLLGDYIDRGPDSKGVIDVVKKLVESGEAKAVRGNHEDFAINYYIRQGNKDIWMYNGGINTLASYGGNIMHQDHVSFLAHLPNYLEFQGFFFSHAPVPRETARTGRKGWDADSGDKGDPYTNWELTWYYFGPEGEKSGGLMEQHEGPLSQHETGVHLTGVCGHIHRGPAARDVRIFPKYRMLDVGAGCFTSGSLAAHECISGRTLYARPEDL